MGIDEKLPRNDGKQKSENQKNHTKLLKIGSFYTFWDNSLIFLIYRTEFLPVLLIITIFTVVNTRGEVVLGSKTRIKISQNR